MGYYIASVFAFLVFFSLNAMERFCSCRFCICSFFTPTRIYYVVGLYFDYSLRNRILLLPPCLMMYYIVPFLFLLAFRCPCMTINVII